MFSILSNGDVMYSISHESHQGIARYFNLHPDQQSPDIQSRKLARKQKIALNITGDYLQPTITHINSSPTRRIVIPNLSRALNALPTLAPPEDWYDARPESWRRHDPLLIQQAKGLTFHNYDQRYQHHITLTPAARRYYADLALKFHMETVNNRGGTTVQVTTFLEAFGQGLVLPYLTWQEYSEQGQGVGGSVS